MRWNEKKIWKANWVKDNLGSKAVEAVTSTPAPSKTPAAPTSAAGGMSKYKPGLVENGYRFKGGDPAKEANWEKVSK